MKRLLLLFTFLAAIGSFAVADQNKGAKEMELHGGSRGKVPFTHLKHQERLGDCNTCHAMFPQASGAIEAKKQSGELKKKHVMNTLCIKCHRTERKAGKPYGPVTCSKCHVRD